MKGHTAIVNSVHMNPKDHNLLVSCSDDMTIRLWHLDYFEPSLVSNRIQKVNLNGDADELMSEEDEQMAELGQPIRE